MLFSRSSRFSRFSTPIRFSCAFFASMASLLVAAPQSARAQAKQAVAPNSLTNVEGNSSSTLFFNSAGLSFQQQIAASELTNFTANGSQITGFSVRLNGGAAAITADGSFDSYQITLSQAANSIANISTTYANNIVNPVTVYNRALSIPASSFSSGSAAGVANAFGATFTFDTAYTYRGGDLVMTVNKSARTGGAPAYSLDATSSTGGQGFGTTVYAQYGQQNSATATNGATPFTVLRLSGTDTPEPGTLPLVGMGLVTGAGTVGAVRRRKALHARVKEQAA